MCLLGHEILVKTSNVHCRETLKSYGMRTGNARVRTFIFCQLCLFSVSKRTKIMRAVQYPSIHRSQNREGLNAEKNSMSVQIGYIFLFHVLYNNISAYSDRVQLICSFQVPLCNCQFQWPKPFLALSAFLKTFFLVENEWLQSPSLFVLFPFRNKILLTHLLERQLVARCDSIMSSLIERTLTEEEQVISLALGAIYVDQQVWLLHMICLIVLFSERKNCCGSESSKQNNMKLNI